MDRLGLLKIFSILMVIGKLSHAQISNETDTTTSNTTVEITTSSPDIPLSPICLQPQIRGDCKALFRRYFYDPTSKNCREFFYGGCGGNENNFQSKSECQEKCVPSGSIVPDEPENTTQSIKMGRCLSPDGPFNFSDSNWTVSCSPTCVQDSDCPDDQLCCNVDACGRALCMAPMVGTNDVDRSISSAVVAPPNNPICQKPLDSGPCRAYIPRWGFDGSACVQFVYGGCHGNENSFETKEECDGACGVAKPTTTECPMVKIVPPPGCEVIPSAAVKNGCPMPEIRCTEGACAANPCPSVCENCINEPKQCFTTPCPQYRCEARENCVQSRIALPIPPALPTPPALPDATSTCALVLCAPGTVCRSINGLATCVPDPIFISMSRASPRAQVICQSQPDVGRCRAAIERWFFDIRTLRCERFTYGGCGGNENNFDSRQSCESFCSAFINSVPATTTPDKSSQCPKVDLAFNDGGICISQCDWDSDCPNGGKCCSNGCGKVCMTLTTPATTVSVTPSADVRSPPRPPPSLVTQRQCRQPAVVGPCKAAFERWYFNSFSGACETFTFGGCQGNTNNFETREQCVQNCDQVPACPQYNPPFPVPGCNLVSWIGTDGCPTLSFKCTEGECAHQSCSGKCEFCVNEPKQCFTTPCPQYRCQSNETCLYDQCSTIRCANGSECKIVNNTAACVTDSSTESRCYQPQDTGPCLAAMVKFYFNSGTGQCEQFVYGGCEGNTNRFNSLDQCQRTCGPNF